MNTVNSKETNSFVRRNLILSVIMYGIFALCYLSTNLLTGDRAKHLFLFEFEKSIPIVPYSVIFYNFSYIQPLFAVLFYIKKDKEFLVVLKSLAALIAMHTICFLVYPTTMLDFRPNPYDTPIIQNSLFKNVWYLMHMIDEPTNCFPSEHCAMAVMFAIAVFVIDKKWGLFFIATSISIMISTLTTKQHYFLDVLGGTFVAGLVCSSYMVPQLIKIKRMNKKNVQQLKEEIGKQE
eukprot:TRINITY_DN4616_c0_g1_i1.p1 TRINITY_DN4616_c0_g1~~TRINITY_DN4616_c0_g1_i1.p1  ORF type:complete len:245 (-),score=46.20 TRINITY_DN4616_c0_g1_i1:16-720(-)